MIYCDTSLLVAALTPEARTAEMREWLGARSAGELCISPVGLSTYTKLAPKKYYSQLMGLWFVGAALGNLIAGLFAGNFDENNVAAMPDLFHQVFFYYLI